MTLEQYINNLNQRYQLGNATEHTFRGDLQQLLESVVPDIQATNEPKRQSCGAPDYILTKKEIPVGFIEAKDIGDKDLDGAKKTGNKEQFDRYKASLNNLIFTDYLNFHLYRDGEFVTKISIGVISTDNSKIVPLPENFAMFENLIKDFCSHISQTIKSSKKLAEMMAGKARLLSDVIEKALTSDENKNEDSTLKDQMTAFQQILIHDITPKGFADVYAQTIAYGMFAARLHDPTLPTFSRQEAAELIPKSNPFLRKLFGYIAGPDIDDRIKWIVDSLVEIFLACNVEEILKNYGKTTKMEDPIIHFYETFLSEYDPKLRKARGVWYTPQPVVNFIVRAVDDILKTEFDLPQGLADTSKTKIKVNVQGKTVDQEVHKVQILDPATGTGTFLAETIKHIHKKFKGQQGIWSNYVETHLLPRLNGFELLMASYAMAHLKLDLLLTETGYKPTTNQRFRVYLTNSLEEHHQDTGTLFANWLSSEANEANHIKRDSPVMCVIGNPPYSGESANKGEWIMKLMEDYKKEPGGKEKLKERNPKWINDDYVKFLRYGQHFIEKNGSGILAFINPHGFLDNPTFRGMRWNLLKTYDKIYTIDLHGNSKKKETAPDGSADVNVFDIMQGVSINLFVKTGKKKSNELGKVFHFDLLGKREMKYDFLNENSLKTVNYKELPNIAPNYFFTDKDFDEQTSYDKGFSVNEIFLLNNVGIVTARDGFTIHNSKQEVENTITEFLKLDDEDARIKFNLGKDVRDWQVNFAKKDLQNNFPNKGVFTEICYRPFDNKWTYYTGKSKGFHCYPRSEVMQHFTKGKNVGLIIGRQGQAVGSMTWNLSFITKTMTDFNLYYRGGGTTYPIYLYPEINPQQTIYKTTERTPNLNTEIVKQIAEKLGLTFVPEKNSPLLEGCSSGGVVFSPNPTNTSQKEILTTINNIPIYRNFVENLPHNPALNQLAKDKRKEGILSEVLFWQKVHKGVFYKIDFDRQRIIGNYIVDFYVKALGLVIEIDGNSHDEKQEYDAKRQAYLESFGLKVFRCRDIDVKKNINAVFTALEKFIINEYGEKTTPAFSHPSTGGEFSPIDILDYIYAVLHSPSYREKYKEFLKIDFPRVPYPTDQATFWQLVKLGSEIRQIHLLESPIVENYITQYPEDGDNVVVKPRFELSPLEEFSAANKEGDNIESSPSIPLQRGKYGRVYINETQYFDNVPQIAWAFYIGGYQPAQKWLKDRKDRKLEFEDILHYQKIIVALSETDRLMKEIDKVVGEW
jgi:very-short-patch-repair endonuclease